jgi:sugar phosphate isomerase/epimerase
LACCGSHTPLNQLQGSRFEDTVEFARRIGAPYLVVPGFPSSYHSQEGWARAADELNEIAHRLSATGLKVGYHNHAIEFQSVNGGSTPWEVLFGRNAAGVVMQVDTGNARFTA